MDGHGVAARLARTLFAVALATAPAAASAQSYTAIGSLADVDGELYLAGDIGGTGLEPRKLDFSVDDLSTTLVKDVVPGAAGSNPRDFTAVGSTVFFIAGQDELWKTDGTTAGTELVWKPAPSGSSLLSTGINELTAFAGALFFVGCDSVTLCQIYRSDGTTAGTVIVEPPHSGWNAPLSSSSPSSYLVYGLTVVDQTLFFTVNDTSSFSTELWKTDGTADGTVLLDEQSVYVSRRDFVAAGGKLFFVESNSERIWKSDGTSAGTGPIPTSVRLPSSVPGLAVRGGWVFFAGYATTDDLELWKTDGTEAGTVLVKDIRPPGPSGSSSSPEKLTTVGNTVFFTADDGTNGRELWKSDGTEAGTVLVRDITQGAPSTVFASFASHDGRLYFSADDGVNGAFLWRSDGSAAGTARHQDVYGFHYGSPSDLTPVGQRLFGTVDDPQSEGRWLFLISPCYDAIDNDGDGAVDEPADLGCADIYDVSERGPAWACDNGLDDDGEGLIDFPADTGCFGPFDDSELNGCSDGVDNDGDGLVDHPDDVGCTGPDDEFERQPLGGFPCDDGFDNDADGFSDFGGPSADPGCLAADDPSEKESGLVCDDGLDNDGDSFTDAEDTGCPSPSDPDESDPTRPCDNALDDDGDGAADLADAGCLWAGDESERGTVVCDDGVDDDGDGLADFPADPGCASAASTLENPQCNDGINNGDPDGLIDFPADPDCSSPHDNTEKKPKPCGLGGELVLAFAGLARMRARRRRSAR